jgi:ABC-type sugar transport system substrate-binding protein
MSVGCKLPSGLIIQKTEHEQVLLKGANASLVIGGYGITEDVDEAWFTNWLKANADYDPVRQGLVFAQSTTVRAQDQARAQASVKSGFEPMDPENPGPKLVPA